MTLTITESPSSLRHLLSAVRLLRETRVEVGLPSSAPSRLRTILAIQEHGSPVMNIPPRPVVAPALSRPETREAMTRALSQSIESAAAGDESGVLAGFEAAGQAGADGIRAYIDAGISPPNAPLTVSGGWRMNPVARRPVFVPGKGFNKPLYHTGALYRAFSYEVKRA